MVYIRWIRDEYKTPMIYTASELSDIGKDGFGEETISSAKIDTG